MKFRYINIPKLVWQLLRTNFLERWDYAPEQGQNQRTTNLYRICLAICYAIAPDWKRYMRTRSKQYMLAACTPTYGQIQRVLNYWYADEYGPISITQSMAVTTNSYLYEESEPARYLYMEAEPPVFWGRGGNYTEAPTVNIPQALADNPDDYRQFIADLNLLIPFYLTYNIVIAQ